MKVLLAIALLATAACGTVNHRVSGSAETRSDVNITIDIDVSACDSLYGEDKVECIKALASAAGSVSGTIENSTTPAGTLQ